MNGTEAAEQIRSRFNIPVVYLTAYADEKVLEAAKLTEPFGYLMKPFVDRELRAVIEIALYRHGMEKKLKESEKLHKEAQRVAHIGHWELNPEIGTPVWSDEIFRIFGLNPQESEPSFTDHETHLHPDDWPLLNKAVTLASTEGTPFDIIFRIVRPDGEIRWMHAIGTTTKNEKGKGTKVFGTAQDITDLKAGGRGSAGE